MSNAFTVFSFADVTVFIYIGFNPSTWHRRLVVHLYTYFNVSASTHPQGLWEYLLRTAPFSVWKNKRTRTNSRISQGETGCSWSVWGCRKCHGTQMENRDRSHGVGNFSCLEAMRSPSSLCLLTLLLTHFAPHLILLLKLVRHSRTWPTAFC